MSGLPASLTAFTTLTATPTRPHRHSAVVQNSEFLAFAARLDDPQAALDWVAAVRAGRPDASHVCWAYVVGTASRFSDDGEPGGTAGAPILRAIQHEGRGLDHVAALVVRYYGGTNLGTGGLARAYGGTAAECLRSADKVLVRPRRPVVAEVPFAQVGALYHLLSNIDAARGEERYTAGGLHLTLELYAEDVEPFAAALRDATRGAGQLRESDRPGASG